MRTLGDICQLINGRGFKKSEWSQTGLPIIRIQNLNGSQEFNRVAAPVEERYRVAAGDLLYAWSATIGPYIWHGPKAALNQHIFKVVPYAKVNREYLYYLLLEATRELRHAMHGSTMTHILKSQLDDLSVDLPPLAEQRRIVAEIEKQFTRLEAAQSTLRRAEQKSGALLRQVARPCMLQVNSSRALPSLPNRWSWKPAEEVCEFITKGTTPPKQHLCNDGDVPYIKVNNLTFTGALNFEANPTFIPNEIHQNELARSEVVPGDVLMNIVGPPLGKVSRVPSTYPRWNINQAIARFRPKTDLLSEFLTIVLRSTFTLHWLLKMTKATVGQVNLTLETCRAIPIPVPPLDDQREIVDKVAALMSELEANQTALMQVRALAARLRQAILAKAFSGQLVPQDPNDEPASVLLERIRAARGSHKPKPTARRRTPAQLELTAQN